MASTQQTQDFARICHDTVLKTTQCATHCIEQADSGRVEMIKLCLDTAHLAHAAGVLTARGSGYARKLAQVVHEAATKCAQACQEHDDHQVMKDCAHACQELAQAAEGVAVRQG